MPYAPIVTFIEILHLTQRILSTIPDRRERIAFILRSERRRCVNSSVEEVFTTLDEA